MLSRQLETKTVGFNPSTRVIRYPAAGALFNQQNIVPLAFNGAGIQLLQGVGDGQRVGNKIRVKRLRFNFVLRPRQYETGTNPKPIPNMIRIVLFYERQSPTITPAIDTNFFEYNTTATPPSGELSDMLAPINENVYRKFAERTVKLGFAEAYGAGSDVAWQQYANNDYKLNVMMKWDITKYIPKNIRFPDNSSTSSTRGLWAAVLPAPADGSIGVGGTSPLSMDYWLDCEYTDA